MLPRLRSNGRDRADRVRQLLAAHHGPPSPRPVDRPSRRCLPARVDCGSRRDAVAGRARQLASALSDIHVWPRTRRLRLLAGSQSVPGCAVAAVRPRRAGAGGRLRNRGQPAARRCGRPQARAGATARHRRKPRPTRSAAVRRRIAAGHRWRRARLPLRDLGRRPARAAALHQLRPGDAGAGHRRPGTRVHRGRRRHRRDRLQPRADRQSCSHRSGLGAEDRCAPGGRRSAARGYCAGAGGGAGGAVDGPAGGLRTLRAQPDPVTDERRGVRPRWPARRQRRRAVAGQRARIRRRSRTEPHGLVWRVVATPARDARGAFGQPVAEAADQQRSGLLVRGLPPRRTTGRATADISCRTDVPQCRIARLFRDDGHVVHRRTGLLGER